MNPKASPVVRRAQVLEVKRRRGVIYFVLLGITGALLVFTVLGVMILLRRQAAPPVQASTLQAVPPPPVRGPEPKAEPAAPSRVDAPAPPPAPVVPRKPVRPKVARVPFQGTMYTGDARITEAKPTVPAEPLGRAEPVSTHAAPEPAPLLQNEPNPAPAAVEAVEPDPVFEPRRPGRIKRVFGSILRPFRGKRPDPPSRD